MSLGIYPVFERSLPDVQTSLTGDMLAEHFEELDEITEEAGLTPFTSFADNRPIPDDFDGDPEDLADLLGEWDEWFDSAEGYKALQALANHIKTDSRAANRLQDADSVVAELEDIATSLAQAATQGVRFRLEMG